MYAIIDVETTGFSPKTDKITEIAILLHDGKKVVEKYHKLINPERKVPYRITQITGITDSMLMEAPRFFEVAKDIIKLTEDTIIVGHNVAFDMGFLKAEFNEFHFPFERKILCTVNMSRKLIPGQPSYSLGKLTANLGIAHSQKHRAMGDAEATTLLFEQLLDIDPELQGQAGKAIPSALDAEIIKALPHKTGVYYFTNMDKDIIYVGKSINIHNRIVQHLNNHDTRKAIEMKNHIADIHFTLTGSELVSLLLESEEIKVRMPIYNRAQRRNSFHYGLFSRFDLHGYIELYIDKVEEMSRPITSFSSRREAYDFVHMLIEEYELCQKLCSVYDTQTSCFNHQIKKCNGACIQEESPEDYNERVQMAMDRLRLQHENFFVIDKGRKAGERSVVKVENSTYRGFGYCKDKDITKMDKLHTCIESRMHNRDTQSIIRGYLQRNKMELIIY